MAAEMMEQATALLLMALALGMDAFSMCMGMGMKQLRLVQMFKISFLIGTFHVLMPLIGMTLGQLISKRFGNIAGMVSGALLLIIGAQMVLSLSKENKSHELSQPSETGVVLFAMSVSVDSFSVGLSMGLFGTKVLMTVFLFGTISMFMSVAGFLIGRQTRHYVGRYGEALGGLIMLLFGIKLLFHL
ncbi:MAG: manganese efflux pump MntP family protein [Sporolactobacillus sp.]